MDSKKTQFLHRRSKHYQHSEKGQAIAEGTAFLFFLVPICVATILLNLLITVYTYRLTLLTHVAYACARAAVGDVTWLGGIRRAASGFNPRAAAQVDANAAAKASGVPDVKVEPLDFSNPDQLGVTVVDTKVPQIITQLMPKGFTLRVTAHEPYLKDSPPGVAAINFPGISGQTPASNAGAIIIPVYEVGYGGGVKHSDAVLRTHHFDFYLNIQNQAAQGIQDETTGGYLGP